MSDEQPPEAAPEDVASSELVAADDIELAPPVIGWLRLAVFLLAAATVTTIIGLGADGRAAGAWGAFTAGAERIGDAVAGMWDGTRNELQARAAAEPVIEQQLSAPAGSYATTIVVEGSDGSASSIVLAAADPSGETLLVVFPPSLTAIVPGYGDFHLGDTALFEDASLTALTLANSLGIRVDVVIGMTADQLATALSGPLTVELPSAVEVPAGDGATVLAESGRADLSPSLTAAVLLTRGDSDALAWLERQGAVWEAIFTSPAVADFISAASAFAGPGEDAETALAAVAAGELTVGGPPLASIGIGTDEQLVLPGSEGTDFAASRLAHLLLRDGERPRVEVLNGNGRPQTTRLVAETLVRRGFRVIRTDNADSFDYRDSRVIAQGRGNRIPGAEVVGLLGVGQLELEVRAPSGVVDVSIIVGADIPIGEGS